MKKILFVILRILGIGIICYILLAIIFLFNFHIGTNSLRVQSEGIIKIKDAHKIIYFENKLDSIDTDVDLYFIYNQDSISLIKIDTNSHLLNEDPSYIVVYKSSHSYDILPILRNDSISFPESFSIKIKNRNHDNDTILKELDYNSFKEYAIPKGITNKEDFLSANEWTLVIDSTLLDLK